MHLVQPIYLLPCPFSAHLVLQDIRVQEAQEQLPMQRHQCRAQLLVLLLDLDYRQSLEAILELLVI